MSDEQFETASSIRLFMETFNRKINRFGKLFRKKCGLVPNGDYCFLFRNDLRKSKTQAGFENKNMGISS